ncbi:MAG: flavodoxin [Clostridia bacterium]|jgi:flavodoxin|nr:flavodoxin [Clostridia bacterium]
MKIEVRYYTKTGHTKKLAESIAKQAGVLAKPISEPVAGEIDILFLGEGLYNFGIDPLMKEFIQNLKTKNIKRVVIFSTAAFGNAYGAMKQELEAKGLTVSSQAFNCRGNLGILHKGRPNEKDLQKIEIFTQSILSQ